MKVPGQWYLQHSSLPDLVMQNDIIGERGIIRQLSPVKWLILQKYQNALKAFKQFLYNNCLGLWHKNKNLTSLK